MNNKLSVSVALAAGLAGGMVTRYIAPPPVFAQAQAQVAPVTPPPTAVTPAARGIRAQSFVLVDANDNVAGTFTTEPTGPVRVFIPNDGRGRPQLQRTPMRIVLRDAWGHEIWSAGGTVVRPLAAVVR